MLRKLIAFSLQNAALVLLLAAMLLGFAAYVVPRMPVDVFPELNAPTVVVLTEAKGLAADEVEQYVTFPIESAVNGAAGVRRSAGRALRHRRFAEALPTARASRSSRSPPT